MSKVSNGESDPAKTGKHERNNEDDDRAMSPEIRRLILSYTEPDSERTWNADSFTGRRANAA